MAGGRPTKLTPELIELARATALECPSYSAIANACGVNRETLRTWLLRAETEQATELEKSFLAAIHDALAQGEKLLAAKLRAGDPNHASWLLTHSPFYREQWSDAAAERRAVAKALGLMIESIKESALPLDLEHRILLNMQARGLGVNRDPAD